MKNLRTYVLCVSITLYSVCSFAQNQTVPVNEPDYNKPKLFLNLPDNITVTVSDLNALLDNPAGRNININLAEKTQSPFQFEGEVISVSSKEDNNIRSVVIRSSNYNGARFTLSRITNADGTITYSGRIMSFKHGDLYELQKKNGNFILVKKNFYDLVNE